MLQSLFTNNVKIKSAVVGETQGVLYPEERAFIAGACQKRQNEFSTGRYLARSLLKEFGVMNFPLLKGAKNEPLWPAGFCGSISHVDDLCIAAVSRKEEIAGLGLDVVTIEEVFDDLWPAFCTVDELNWLRSLPECERQKHAALIFCAKESVYKCLYPVIKEWIDFKDASVSLMDCNARSSFDAVFQAPKGRYIAENQKFRGNFLFDDRYVFTSLTLSASYPFGAQNKADYEIHI